MANLPAKQSKVAELRTGLTSWLDQLPAVLPSSTTKERIIDVATLAAHESPLIQKCTKGSLVKSILGAARYNLEIGGALGHAYLVPFRDGKTGDYHAQLIVGYLGLIDLSYRHEKVAAIESGVVHEGDTFAFQKGTDKFIRHIPAADADDAKVTHVYSIITLTTGEKIFEVMSKAQVDKVRARSKARKSGPWVTDYEPMAMKTVFKRCCKWAPKTHKFAQALSFDTKAEAADTGFIKDAEITVIHPDDDSEPPPDLTTAERLAEETAPSVFDGEPPKDAPPAKEQLADKLPVEEKATYLAAAINNEVSARNIGEELFMKWVREVGMDANADIVLATPEKLGKLLAKCQAFGKREEKPQTEGDMF